MGRVVDQINYPQPLFLVFFEFVQVGKISAVQGGKGHLFVLLLKNMAKQKGEGGGGINVYLSVIPDFNLFDQFGYFIFVWCVSFAFELGQGEFKGKFADFLRFCPTFRHFGKMICQILSGRGKGDFLRQGYKIYFIDNPGDSSGKNL